MSITTTINENVISESVMVHTTPDVLWQILTQPKHMKQWLGEPEMNIEVETDWSVNSLIQIKGFHHITFVNTGRVLEYVPNTTLSYSQLDSISRLEDTPGNYSILTFRLLPQGDGTTLSLTIQNFPTLTIYKHLAFYWKTTMQVIQQYAEQEYTNQQVSI